jgi:radical SAM protein with 4Fe4S-binding SPASM domain
MVASSGAVNFDVVTCVNRRNNGSLSSLRDFLIGLGLKQWRLFTIFPSGRAATDPDLQLTSDEFRSLMEFIKETRRSDIIKASYGCEGFLGNYEGEVRDNLFNCEAGVTVASVLADGAISACPSIRADYHQGYIYRDNFIDVWNNGFGVMRDRSWMKTGLCRECKFWKYCHGNGMHLRDENGHLAFCHLERLEG